LLLGMGLEPSSTGAECVGLASSDIIIGRLPTPAPGVVGC
jgi:hypothetical protein